MSDFAPKLRQIKVAPEKLILDPNNPRLITRDEDKYSEADAMDLGDKTLMTMRDVKGEEDRSGDAYKIKELENSIRQNGWWPVDYIFVKKYKDDGYYLVLEGNRRVTAIRNIRNDDRADATLKKSLDQIEVMEIIDEGDPEVLRTKITYLLGVRHHGSLKRWRPFAQARNIFMRYLEVSKQAPESFNWRDEYGQKIADALSIDLQDVKERLSVYKAMEQLSNMPQIKESEPAGGMKDRYYSVCQEVLLARNRALEKYIVQNDTDFLLTEESLQRMNNLCHFDRQERAGSPINNPQEWRKFAKILEEENADRKQQMLSEVEVNKRYPSDVWAERAAELQTLQWDKWLLKVHSIMKKVSLGDDLESTDARNVIKKLSDLVGELDALDKH